MSNAVDDYIRKQGLPQREICQKLRELIFQTFPGTEEEIKWGVPAFHQGRFYIVALKDHVNLGFSTEGLSKEEMALFDGGGKTTKHIRVVDINSLDENRTIKLLELVGK